MNLCSQINVEALGWQPYWISRWPPFKHIYFDIASNCRERVMQIKIRPCRIAITINLEEQKFWGKIVVHPYIHLPFWISKWPPSSHISKTKWDRKFISVTKLIFWINAVKWMSKHGDGSHIDFQDGRQLHMLTFYTGSNCREETMQSKRRTHKIGKTIHQILRNRIFEEKFWCTHASVHHLGF